MPSKKIAAADKDVGARIRSLRMMRGLSQKKLAEHSGITFQQVQKYEKGTNRVSSSRLAEFAHTLQVDPAYFFQSDDIVSELTNDALSDAIREFASSHEGINLARAFMRLMPLQRRAIVALVQQIVSLEPGLASQE